MKRGQKAPSGGGAATLVGIVTLLFIFYILFLPPDIREDILTEGDEGVLSIEERLLLNETPGTLSFTEKSVFDHDMPNVFLSAETNAVVLARENPFTVRKGWFGEQRKAMVFAIDDLENTENVVLSFQAPERSGTLIIELNGNTVYEADVSIQNPPPVILPKALLAASNRVEFSVTGGFFGRKRYELSDVKVIGDLVDVTRQEARGSFTVSDVEFDNLEKSFFDFYPICDQREVGVLTIELNGKIIHSSVPSCDSLNRQDIFKEDLRDGKNTITLKIDQGSYRIEQMRLRNTLKPVKAFIDYFLVKPQIYNDILDNDRQAILWIQFVDDERLKRAEININGKLDVIDQRDDEYERDVSSLVKEGNNFIEIKPLTELDIAKIEIRAD